MIIYADIVFLMNFFGDFLCLWVLGEIEGKISVWRRVLSAGLGALYAVFCTYPSFRFAGSMTGRIIIAAVMVAIAYLPAGIKKLTRSTAVFFLSSMLLAGAAEFIGTKVPYKIMLTTFAAGCFLVCAISAVRSRIYAKHLRCCLCFSGKKVYLSGFYDSGNRLLFGENATPVIIGDERILKKLISEEVTWRSISEWVEVKRLVTIPFSGAVSGEMQGIIIDYIKVGGYTYYDAVLAVSEEKLSDSLILNSIMA